MATLAAMLLVALPPALFFALLYLQRSPLPLQDDYSALLDFALRWRSTGGFLQHATLFLSARDGDYKLYFDHACLLASLGFLGRVSISALCWCGNLLWIAVAALLWRFATPRDAPLPERLLLFAPAAALLFQLNAAETFNWAMAGLQNVGVIVFSMAAVAALLRSSPMWNTLSFLCCMAAVCASANGFLLLPVALFLLVKKQPLRAGVLAAGFGALAFAYGWRLELVHKHLAGFWGSLAFVLNFAGGAVENMSGKPFHGAALVFGLFVAGTLAGLLAGGMRKRSPYLFWTTMWILLTAAMVALGRAGAPEGAALARASRYKLYADLLLAILYLDAVSLLRQVPGRGWRRYGIPAALACSAALCVAADWEGWRSLQARRTAAEAEMQIFLISGGQAAPQPDEHLPAHAGVSPIEDYMRNVLNRSIHTGIYRPPAGSARDAYDKMPADAVSAK